MGFNKDIFNPLLDKRLQKQYVPDEQLPNPDAATTDDTPTLMSNSKVLPENSVVAFEAYIVAVQTGGIAGALGDAFARKYVGVIKNIGNVTSIVDEVWFEDIGIDVNLLGLTVSFAANDVDESLEITVTGEINKNISWKCKLVFNQISY